MKNYFISYILITICLGLSIFGFYSIYTVSLSLALSLLLALFFINIISILFIILQHRNFSTKFAWIMIIIIVPLIGHFLFIIFGQRYGKIDKHQKYCQRQSFQYEIVNANNDDPLQSQSNISKRGIYDANFQFFEFSNDAFNAIFEDMQQAKKYIHMHYFIINPGEIYDQFKSILIAKAKQGIEIRLIVDDFGHWSLPKHEIRDLINYGVEVKIFGKIVFPFLNAANVYRTHRKAIIIDSKIVHIGGLNIGDEYASLAPWYGRWIDLQVKIQGAATRSHGLLFIEDWNQLTNQFLDPQKYAITDASNDQSYQCQERTVLVEDSPEIKENIYHDSLLNLIYNARKKIMISTPYFVPTQSLIDALKFASGKGVEVKIFVPGWYDIKVTWFINNYYMQELIPSGIKFYRVNYIFLHTKAGIFDDHIAYIGTANFDKRSFYSQLEFINFFYGHATKKLMQIFNNYEKISKVVKHQKSNFKISYLFAKFFVNIFSPLA